MRIAAVIKDLPLLSGFTLVVRNLLEGLVSRHDVRLFVLERGYYGQLPFPSSQLPCAFEEFAGSNGSPTTQPVLSAASRYYAVDAARLAWLENRVADYGPDRIVGFDYNLSPYIGLLSSGATPKILHVVDSELLHHARQLLSWPFDVNNAKGALAALLAGWENFRKCAAIVTVSPDDTRNLKRYTRACNVLTVANGVDQAWYAPDTSVHRQPNRVIFSGGLSFLPNIQAVTWFVTKCWGRVLREKPDAELVIIGKRPSAALREQLATYPGVRVLGEVEDIRPHVLSAAVSVAPLVSGAGIKNKILEAWALATAVVATSLAARGLRCEDGKQILIGDSPRVFAGHVISLLTQPDKRERIALAGRDHVARNYRWEASRDAFNSIVESAA